MQDVQIAQAVRDIILPLNLTPHSTERGGSIGATSVIAASSADAASFPPGALLVFDDDLGEEPIPVMDSSGATINLDFTGMGYAGLQFAHADGTAIYCNLHDFFPMQIAPLITYGDPVIWIVAQDEAVNRPAVRQTQSLFTVHVQYHRQLIAPPRAAVNPNVWANRQQASARSDLDAISTALQGNHRLLTATGANAEDLGDRAGSRPFLSKSWRKLTATADNQQFVVGLDLIVRAQRMAIALP